MHDPGHGHSHTHGHTHGPARYDRAFAVGIALNLGFTIVEALYGWHAGSLALLADAGHNLSDVAGLVLAWGGAVAGRIRPDARHTYGWKRASIVAAFVNALLLLVAMGSLAWEAVHRFGTAPAVDGGTIVAVAAAGVVVNALTAMMFLRGRHGDLNVRGAFLHMAADAAVSAGVVVSGLLALRFGWTWIDPVVSLAIAAIVVAGTWSLFGGALHLLFDGVPEHIDVAEVRACLASLPGVADVQDLHIWAMGTSEFALTAHLVVPAGDTLDAFLDDATCRLEQRFGIAHATLQVRRTGSVRSCPAPRVD